MTETQPIGVSNALLVTLHRRRTRVDPTRPRYRPAPTDDLTADWTAAGGTTEPYAARRIGGPDAAHGQILSLPAPYTGVALRHRAGQEGWRWFASPWPDRFSTVPVGGFDPAPPPLVEEWYTTAPLVAHPNPPSAPSSGDRVWRVSVGPRELGFLVRAAGLLRWEVRSRFVVDGFLPEVLRFETYPWPLPQDGDWHGAASPRVS